MPSKAHKKYTLEITDGKVRGMSTETTRLLRSEVSELDLEHGDPKQAEDSETPADRRRTTKTTGKKQTTTASRKTAAEKREEEITNRIEGAFDRIADALENKGDTEMANLIREEEKAMSGGLMSVTRTVPSLRPALMLGLNFFEPILAFGKVVRKLFERFAERRARRQAEWEAMQAEQQASDGSIQQQAYPTSFQ